MRLEENAFAKTHDRSRAMRWTRYCAATIYPYPPWELFADADPTLLAS